MKGQNQIIFYSKLMRSKGTTISAHKHGCYELVYYLQGNGAIDIEGVSHPFSSHTYSFSKPHSWQIESHKINGEVLFFGFSSEEEIELEEGVYPDDRNLTMLKIVQDILFECSQQKADYEKMLELKILQLVIALKRGKNTRPDQAYSLEYSVNYIKENYQCKIDFKNLASSCGYSYDYFRHQFQKRTGSSPQQYLIEIRLRQAEALLRKSAMNCTEIAYRCGFCNGAQFSSMFKRHYGVSPKEFQRKTFFTEKEEQAAHSL